MCMSVQCRPHLPILLSGVDRVAEELVDHGHLVLLHNQVVVRMLLSDEETGLTLLLAAFGVDVW